jgi:hypothetical protein
MEIAMTCRQRKWRKLTSILSMVTLCGLLVLTAGASVLAQTGSPLWQRRDAPGVLKADKGVLRGTAVEVDVGRLLSRDNARFSLLMPDGRMLSVTKSGDKRTPKGLVWQGKIVGEPSSSVSFSVVNKTVVGSILRGNGQSFRLRRDPSGVQVIEEIDLKSLPAEADPTPVPGRRGDQANDPALDSCATDGPDSIDVMVAYTQDARAGAGGTDAIEAEIYLAVEETNQAYVNSNINQRLRLVHVAEVSYPESKDSNTDLLALRDKADTFLTDVHTLRDSHGADIVALLVNQLTNACGQAFTMDLVGNAFESYAFAVIDRHCATLAGKYTFAHELAHVMSARHDWNADSKNNAPYPYNHGHVQATASIGTPWRTIMAYDNTCSVACPRVLNFSNPNISVGGDPTGTATGAQQEDNHLALNNTALTVANFRCSSPGRADVWMRDTWSDTGQEPDPAQAALAMWESPYIWVRNKQDTLLTQQHEHQNPINGQPNFVYIKIHNGGTATSGNLEVSFANASVGLSWPTDWTLISSVPVTSFAAHSTMIVEMPWTPTVAGSLCKPPLPPDCHYCLIARWISPTDPMTSPEGSNIDANVRGNNNVVWKNVNVVDLGGDSQADAIFLVQNAAQTGSVFLEVRPVAPRTRALAYPTFLDIGQVVLTLDHKLMRAWKAARFAGTGFRRRGNVIIVSDKKGAKLALGRLHAKFKAPVKVSFSRPTSEKFPRDEFLLRVLQTDGRKKTFGGITYQIRTRAGS